MLELFFWQWFVESLLRCKDSQLQKALFVRLDRQMKLLDEQRRLLREIRKFAANGTLLDLSLAMASLETIERDLAA